MDTKTLLREGARWLCAALAMALILSHALKNRTSRAAFETVRDAVVPAALSDGMKEADVQLAKRMYGLNPADYEGFALYAPVSNMDAEELLIVKLADPSQGEALLAAAEKRLQTQKNTFDGYGVEQTALLNDHAATQLRGNYFLFVVSEKADAACRAFSDAL